ncbi:MAG: prepilin-type N-terminal cleavage/methylation domain-containing protein [Planctomycetota bacterium]
MSARTLKAKGFTLVEILIVVVILGILAAIVIPQFTSASESAKASSLVTQLQSLRSQLELYQLEHNGDYPGLNAAGTGLVSSADFWADLTGTTDVDGAAATTGITYGPYLQKEIVNPFEDTSTIVASIGTVDAGTGAAADVGFIYDPLTGEIKAVVEAAKAADVNFDTADGDIATY